MRMTDALRGKYSVAGLAWRLSDIWGLQLRTDRCCLTAQANPAKYGLSSLSAGMGRWVLGLARGERGLELGPSEFAKLKLRVKSSSLAAGGMLEEGTDAEA